jgi:hypothetical protein
MAGAVVIPHSQTIDEDDRGEPLSVQHAMVGYMVPIKYYDKLGKPHTEMVFVVGDTVYKDPNGERWASGLKVLSDDVADQVKIRIKDHLREQVKSVLVELGVETSGTIKAMGDVDVLADEVDAETTGEASP